MSVATDSAAGLLVRDHRGKTRAASFGQVIAAARAMLDERVRPGVTLGHPSQAADYLTLHLADRGHEVFAVLYLDGRNRLITWSELFRGTINGATVHPREVVKEALAHNAAAVIACHNHPSGVAEPSAADETITARLRDALALVEIELLDHVIVAGGAATSLAARGLCSPARTVEALQFRAAADQPRKRKRRRHR